MDTGSNTVDMGARRFGPDVSRFLTPDLFFGALSNLSLSLDPITQNRYGLAGGNPISFKEWNGHQFITDGGGGAATTPSLAPDRCGGCDGTSTSVQRDAGRSGGGSSVGSSLLNAGKEALTKCFKKGDPSDFGFAAAVLSPICNPEKRTVPNPRALCSLTASNTTGLSAGVRLECAAPPDLQHDPVLKAASSTGGDPEDALDAVLSRNAVKAEERQSANESREISIAAGESWGDPATLADHFARHGADFGATTADEYAAQASAFLQRSQAEGLPTKVDSRGVIRVYDPNTNTFGAYNPNGTTRTFYKPDPSIHGYPTNWDYWLAQPGSAPWTP